MNNTKLKKIIAREWLIFLVAMFIGVNLSVILYFTDSSDYISHRKNLYESLRYEYQKNKLWIKDGIILKNPYDQFDDLKNFRKKYPEYNDLDDSTLVRKLSSKYIMKTLPYISYNEFTKILDDKSKRKKFYDSASANYDLGSYETFKREVTKPTFYSGFSKLFDHLFIKWFWFSTLISLLIPYIGLQLLRSIFYSIRLLTAK